MCCFGDRNTEARDDANEQSDREVPRRMSECEVVQVEEEVDPPQAHLQVLVHGDGHDLDDVRVTATLEDHDPLVCTTGTDAATGVADFGDVDPGIWHITITFEEDDANDRAYVIRPGEVEVDLDENADHEERIEVDPKLRIRLGYEQGGVQARTWIRFYVPRIVGSGGNGKGHYMALHISSSAGQLQYRGTDPTNDIVETFDVGDTWQNLAAQGPGWHYAQLVNSDANVTIWLYEQGFAREAGEHDADPIIPWNFYFWSSSRLMAAGNETPVAFLASDDVRNMSGYSPFEKFDEEFELDTQSFDWEADPQHDSHNDLGRNEPNPITWQGHCNWMGAASIVLQTPVGIQGPQHNVDFDAEELKLFAAEYAGNHTQDTKVWELSDHADVMPGNASSVIHLLPALVVHDPLAPQWKCDRAAQDRLLLGPVAAGFFTTLRDQLAHNGHPLLLDMRATYQDGEALRTKSDEVWNQASFYYEAWYSEHGDASDRDADTRQAQDLAVSITLHANADGELPTTDPPADVVNDNIVMDPGHSWNRTYVLRLQFTNNGNVDPNDASNTWDECKSGDADCFLPRYLARIDDVLGEAIEGGANPFVTPGRIATLGLARRARYQ